MQTTWDVIQELIEKVEPFRTKFVTDPRWVPLIIYAPLLFERGMEARLDVPPPQDMKNLKNMIRHGTLQNPKKSVLLDALLPLEPDIQIMILNLVPEFVSAVTEFRRQQSARFDMEEKYQRLQSKLPFWYLKIVQGTIHKNSANMQQVFELLQKTKRGELTPKQAFRTWDETLAERHLYPVLGAPQGKKVNKSGKGAAPKRVAPKKSSGRPKRVPKKRKRP